MALSDYTGRTPHAQAAGEVRRVSRHTQWNVGDGARADCAFCGSSIDLGTRHVLVTLSEGDDGSRDPPRRHLCTESCLAQWFADD
jgi:hypothetical protein